MAVSRPPTTTMYAMVNSQPPFTCSISFRFSYLTLLFIFLSSCVIRVIFVFRRSLIAFCNCKYAAPEGTGSETLNFTKMQHFPELMELHACRNHRKGIERITEIEYNNEKRSMNTQGGNPDNEETPERKGPSRRFSSGVSWPGMLVNVDFPGVQDFRVSIRVRVDIDEIPGRHGIRNNRSDLAQDAVVGSGNNLCGKKRHRCV